MHTRLGWLTVLFALSILCNKAYCQQDVDFHLIKKFFAGKNVLKVKRDYHDPYLWVLAQNNEVYRVNSLTQKVDDYTSYFTANNNLQFVDIAGYSQDTVFVATNSSTLLELKKDILKTIGTADGITSTIGQIGLSNPQNVIIINSNEVTPSVLLISTGDGLFQYDVINEKVTSYYNNDNNGIQTLFETTYRNQIYCYKANPGYYNSTDSAKAIQLGMQFPVTLFVANIWYKLQAYGYHINTAYNIKSFYPDNFFYPVYSRYYEDDYLNEVYGTEKGLYLNSWNYSIYSPVPYYHYLDGIKVNKVTSIYGLASFPQLMKENLLIGTDQGLYFSNSSFQKYDSLKRNSYNSFTLDNDIGNKVVNDICVDANSYMPKVNGAYQETICEDGAWVAAADGLYFIKPDYTPYTDTTQVQAINFIEQPDSSSVKICAGSTVTASSNNNYYSGNSVQWYRDGSVLSGHTADTLKINTSGNYRAVLYDPCQNIHLQSNQLQVNVISVPQFTFNYPDETNSCQGSPVTLTAKGDPNYKYRWYRDDTLLNFITPSVSVANTGKYKVEVSACPDSWVSSKEVQLNFIKVPVPVVVTDKSAYCIGDNATLTLPTAPDHSYTINWYKDNVLVPAYNNQSVIITNLAGSYTAVIVSNTNSTNGQTCSETSNAVQLFFNAKPTLTIQQHVNTTLCQGQSVTLKAVHSVGIIKWSTGETSDEIDVSVSGTYTAALTSASGCMADTSSNVTFLINPILSVRDTTICTYKQQILTLTAPAGFLAYAWNNVAGKQTFNVTYPQTVVLTVTDGNGCQAIEQIHITEQCPDVFIPNTFTPNGDGINDVWDVQGLDASALIKIFNRYGAMIYQNKGYSAAWDGHYRGQKLPAGTYYYIINVKNNAQTFSGPVTILY